MADKKDRVLDGFDLFFAVLMTVFVTSVAWFVFLLFVASPTVEEAWRLARGEHPTADILLAGVSEDATYFTVFGGGSCYGVKVYTPFVSPTVKSTEVECPNWEVK